MQYRVTSLGEISNTRGFDAPDIYIMTEVLLPEGGWLWEDVCEYELSGVSREKSMEINKRSTCTHIS